MAKTIQQLSVFLENKEGRLDKVLQTLGEGGVNIVALSLADSSEYGMLRMSVVCKMYFLCGIMDVLVGILRGMGYAIMPMIVSLSGACLLRIIWIMTVFEHFRSLRVLYLSYPVTWTITGTVHFICLMLVFKKLKNKFSNEE